MNVYYLGIIFIILGYSFRWSWWLKNKKGLKVLVYHKVGYPPKFSKLKELWVTPENFEKHISYLLRNNYKIIGFSDLKKYYDESKPVDDVVLITFDDGYENNYLYAYPILKKYGVKGNIFVVYNTIGKTNIWHNPKTEPWLNMATKEQLIEMYKSGIIEFGSHTMNHPKLENIPFEDAVWEIIESKKQLENLFQNEIISFAYPYGNGAYNEKIRKIVKENYIFDFSFKQGITPWPWDRENFPIDRLFIKYREGIFDLKLHLSKGRNKIL
ncbi:MAG: polysaccharide deacetylase family protein [Elusimicrobiales bacterium]|nr:polysaccharide deacetylase family protein [Elusimicrobiales bacterium]